MSGATNKREAGGLPEEVAARVPSGRLRPFGHVPTHVIGVAHERRRNARAYLHLPLRLTAVNGQPEPVSVTLLTKNISSSGVCFFAPRHLEPGTAIELEVALVERPLGQGSVRMATAAHVVRTEPSSTPGWHSIAVCFDDFDFHRDEALPQRFRQP
jgi:hypothetical protein